MPVLSISSIPSFLARRRASLPPANARLYISRLAALTALLVVGAAAAGPVTSRPPAGRGLGAVALQAAKGVAPSFELREVVGPGADVDGDGAPDFVNPTGETTRESDAFGSGAFHASRDGGMREHEGVDYLALAGRSVAAPISGYVTAIGYAYDGDARLRYVELTNAALGYAARVFYVAPSVVVGEAVHLGRSIGTALSLQGRYPGIADHVHVEISRLGRGHVDPTALIPTPTLKLARMVRSAASG